MLILYLQRNTYEQLGNDRTLATVRVLSPENPMRGMWQLLWTIKRERDPNGRELIFLVVYYSLGGRCGTDIRD